MPSANVHNCYKLAKRLGVPHADATTLLAAALHRDTIAIVAYPELQLTRSQLVQFVWHCWQYRRGKPMAYLLGERIFCDRNFLVTSRVLIPRPGTEFLVEQGLTFCNAAPTGTPIIDIGTGSGNIIISIAATVGTAVPCYGIDASRAALLVAKKNARRHTVPSVTWLFGDLIAPLRGTAADKADGLILLANLPYLPKYDYVNAPKSVRRFEPRRALVAGHDGLYYYRRLVAMLAKRNVSSPQRLWACWEADACNTGALARLIVRTFPTATVNVKRDAEGYKRYVIFTV
ncbi:MAG: HemK family protein methyltransferase [Patescibacteria group bacterium]